MNLVFFSYVFLSVGVSVAFIPGVLRQFGDWSSITHRIITRSGLWSTVIEFLEGNPQYANEKQLPGNLRASLLLPGLFEGQIPHKLFGLVKSSKFEDAVDEIETANVEVDSNEDGSAEAHFDAEQFNRSSRRLIDLKKQVIALINKAGDNEGNYAKARKEAGKYLHTLQDFYSHSNWIEIGNRAPLKILGDEIIPEKDVAGPDQETCRDCTPANPLKLFFQTDDCQANLILDIHKLTSGYFGGQDVAKPQNVGKCSHGGLFDSSRDTPSKGGINKDSNLRYLSPHYRLHKQAASTAIQATKLFFDSIREAVGDKKFSKFLSMEAERTLSFAIDTTGSMGGEIAGVRRATVQFIEDSVTDNEAENFYYVLVPFNDPGFGPAYVTRDPDVAKNIANSLTANGGGDCPELGMNGLYLALTHSLPNSDVFYFSDASAKDAHLASVVLSIALTKQCRIYFFISGRCSRRRKRRNLSGQDLYESLATATGGQLLEFSKTNIDDIISLVRRPNVSEANSSSRLQEVSLLTIQVQSISSTTDKPYYVKSDSSILSMTAVLNANGNANIKIIPPQDHKQTGNITVITKTSTVYSVRITKPVVGSWRFKITAVGSYSFQVTAQSNLAFFSSLQGEEYSGTFEIILVPISGNPIKGRKLFVTVTPSQQGVLLPGRNLTAYVIDTAGNELDSFDLEHGRLFYNNSYYGSVILTFGVFKLMYVGYSKNGEMIQRILSRLIKPQTFEIKIKLSAENSSLVISPNETTSFNVTLHNYGSRERFSIVVSDEKSFVASYGPKDITLSSNNSADIQINLLAPFNTSNATTSSVSISASVRSSSGSADDMANFLSLGVSVFSKEFLFVNETELEAVNLTSFLIPPPKKDDSDQSDDFPLYAIILIAVGGVVLLASCARLCLAMMYCSI